MVLQQPASSGWGAQQRGLRCANEHPEIKEVPLLADEGHNLFALVLLPLLWSTQRSPLSIRCEVVGL